MKRKYITVLLIILCCILSACQKKPADSEAAMNNFLNRLEEGNYVMKAKDYLTTTVYSRDQVNFEYDEDTYNDFTAVSVNDEAFQIYLDEQPPKAQYLGEGQAIDVAAKRLPNGWLNLAEGNIWNLFYNTQEDPLKFVSYDDTLKQSVLSLVGYSDMTLRLMHEVYLTLDKEDPSTAHIQAEMDEDMVARLFPEDIDVEITFGNAQSNATADAWMADPVYPDPKTGWDDVDEFIFNSVFLPEYGLEAVPFPAFASYAMTVDQENFVTDDEVCIRDPHAIKQDMDYYAADLIAAGFRDVKETVDGVEKTFYRKLLREDYKCYSSIELEYNNGVNLIAKKWYDFPVYDDLDSINNVVEAAGYPALPASENFTSCKGTDRASEMSESWLYFFNYDLGLYVDVDYKDKEETLNYIKEYEEALSNAGFMPVKDEEEEDAVRYDSENGFYSFRYNFLDDDTVSFLFKSEKYIGPAEAEQMVKEAGFPTISLSEPITCRDLRAFEKVRYGRERKATFTVSQKFESAEKAEAFLAAYEEALNAEGFDRENPDVVGSLKQVVIYNPEKEMFVGIDYFPEQASVNLDFVAE